MNMPHYRSLKEITLQNSWLTVGVFDGVHLGHQEIIKVLTKGAHAIGMPAAVLSFHPHPAKILGRGEVGLLTLPDERAELLAGMDVDVVITERFTPELSAVSAFDFMSRLTRALGLKHLVIGHDFALGKGREGNATRLTEIGRELGYTVEVIAALSDASGVISSTEIRKLVSAGSVAEAARLMGRPYSLRGPVIRGDGRGRKIGVPTANIDYSYEKIIPAMGIYAGWASVDGKRHQAAISIGINPTFTPDKQVPSVEAHILDFDEDIYGEQLKIEFIARLRAELKFDSVNALVEQIWKDVTQVRELLENG
jgi:riboflavin kinase / FMN adenylyltransferase